MKPEKHIPQAYLEEVMRLAVEAWEGKISEFRVMSNRNGASVMPTTRSVYKFSTGLERKAV